MCETSRRFAHLTIDYNATYIRVCITIVSHLSLIFNQTSSSVDVIRFLLITTQGELSRLSWRYKVEMYRLYITLILWVYLEGRLICVWYETYRLTMVACIQDDLCIIWDLTFNNGCLYTRRFAVVGSPFYIVLCLHEVDL